MKHIFRALKKVVVRVATWLGLIKSEDELTNDEIANRRASAQKNLEDYNVTRRPSVLTTLLLTVLFAGAVYVELHLLAIFLGLALVCCLISYVTIQNWIDIAERDVDHQPNDPPAWHWPKGEDFAQ
jgi:hypothetical protein